LGVWLKNREGLNMLGLKIAATGLLAMLLSGVAIRAVGGWPGVAKGLPLVLVWFGGAAATVVGLLMTVWA